MAEKVLVTLEYGNGGFSCYNVEPVGQYALIDGDGKTAEDARADFLRAPVREYLLHSLYWCGGEEIYQVPFREK